MIRALMLVLRRQKKLNLHHIKEKTQGGGVNCSKEKTRQPLIMPKLAQSTLEEQSKMLKAFVASPVITPLLVQQF